MKKIIEITEELFNSNQSLIPHIVQSSPWAQFQNKLGKKVIYIGIFDDDTITSVYLLYITGIKKLGISIKIGVVTQSSPVTKEFITFLKELGKREKLIYIKLEPRIKNTIENHSFLQGLDLIKGRDLFLKSTFLLDLKKFTSTDKLFAHFSSSTRRNIRLAQKKGVIIEEADLQDEKVKDAIHIFYDIHTNTTVRKNFSTHSLNYFELEASVLKEHFHIFHAKYKDEYIGSIILFTFQDTCYYPYGGTLHKYIDTKSTNLLVSTAIQFAYEQGLHYFDFWGALSPETPLPNPLEGVHNFKKGYGGGLNDFVGAYDLVIKSSLYKMFNTAYKAFWKLKKIL